MDGVQGFVSASDVTGSNELISMELFAPFMGVDVKKITPEQVKLVINSCTERRLECRNIHTAAVPYNEI